MYQFKGYIERLSNFSAAYYLTGETDHYKYQLKKKSIMINKE